MSDNFLAFAKKGRETSINYFNQKMKKGEIYKFTYIIR